MKRMRTLIVLSLAVAATALLTVAGIAQPQEDLHRDAEHLRREAERMMLEAERLEMHAREMEIEMHEPHEAHETHERQGSPVRDDTVRVAQEGLEHLAMAIELFEMAGIHEVAGRLRAQEAELRQALHAHLAQMEQRGERRSDHERLAAHVAELTAGFHQLHRHVEELTDVVRRLERRVDEISD